MNRHISLRSGIFAFGVLGVLAIASCSSGGGGGDGDDSDFEGTSFTPGSVIEPGATKCGVVNNGNLENPPSYGEAEPVSLVAVHDSNLVEVNRGGNSTLIKLHAMGNTAGFDNTAARSVLSSVAATDTLYLFEAGCSAQTSLGEATVGQVITAGGRSFSEAVIEERVGGVIGGTGECDETAMSSCYSLINSTVGAAPVSGQQVSDFLWKPNSESPYNPGGVSILLNPCDVRVLVNGQEFLEYPTGNGRCTTVRSGKPGCEFGSSVKVEILEKGTGNPVYFGTSSSVTIPNGCDRFEYAGSGSGDSGSPAHACSTSPTTVSYRPSYEACGGNAAVILTGEFASAFSVQLRLPDGGDRLDESCAAASCSPYKVQQYIDGAGTKTACFGAPGNANLMEEVHHVSIKMEGTDSDPDRFCIEPTVATN